MAKEQETELQVNVGLSGNSFQHKKKITHYKIEDSSTQNRQIRILLYYYWLYSKQKIRISLRVMENLFDGFKMLQSQWNKIKIKYFMAFLWFCIIMKSGFVVISI